MPTAMNDQQGGFEIDSRERLLDLISKLAKHLAIELDYHYEDSDARSLVDRSRALESATAILFLNGKLVPDVVHHTTERFMVPVDRDGNPLDEDDPSLTQH